MLADIRQTERAGACFYAVDSLTGGGTSGNVTLNLNTAATDARYAQLAAANTFIASQTVSGNLSATGVVTGSSHQIGSNLFAFGSNANGNAFLGFAGNTTSTGLFNTGSGLEALFSNTTGSADTAAGTYALAFNTTGSDNTANGFSALNGNTTGCCNIADGYYALAANTTGTGNTAGGYVALEFAAGTNNTGLGTYAGNPTNSQVITGSGNTYIGYQANSGTPYSRVTRQR